MGEYIVVLHDDNDYQSTIRVIAGSRAEARENPLVTAICKRDDMHIVSVREAANVPKMGQRIRGL